MTRMAMKGEVKRECGVESGEWGWENNSPIPHSPFPTRRSLFALLLCLCLFTSYLTVGAQSSAQPARDQKQERGGVIEKDDAIVYVAFTLLVECCLPNGTRLT